MYILFKNTHILELFLVIIISFILTTFLTWPFIAKISSYYSDFGDYPYNGSTLWYNQKAIKTGKIFNQKLYFERNQFYPLPYTLAYNDNMIIPSLIFAPIYWITQNLPFSVNALSFLTFILNFIAAYYFIKHFVKNFYASILGACVYAFNPLIFSHYPNHLNLESRYFIPLIFLYFYKYFKMPVFTNAFLLFLFLTLNFLSSTNFSTFILISIFIISIIHLTIYWKRKEFTHIKSILKNSVIFIFFLPIIIYFNLPYINFSQKEEFRRTVEENISFSAQTLDWISSLPNNFIYGKLVKSIEPQRNNYMEKDFNYSEHTLSLNIFPLLLFVVGIFYFKTFKKRVDKQTCIFIISLIIVLFISFLFTFGPFLKINGNNIPLPLYLLLKYTPFLDGARVPTRFQFIFYIPFILILSYGFAALLGKIKKKFHFTLFIIILFLILLENVNIYNYDETSTIFSNAEFIHKKFKFLENKNTLHLPIFLPKPKTQEYVKATIYLNWTSLTNETTFNGYGGYIAEDWMEIASRINTDLNKKAMQDLQALGINYIIIHKDMLTNGYLPDYEQKYSLLKNGRIFENHSLLIVDLSKFYFPNNTCFANYKQKVLSDINIVKFYDNNNYEMVLDNKENCYIINKYNDRYFELKIRKGNQMHNLSLKLPIIIYPYQKIILSKINH